MIRYAIILVVFFILAELFSRTFFTDFNYNNISYNIDENHKIAELDHSYFLKQINKKEKKIIIYKFKELICELQNIVELSYKPLSGELEVFRIAKKIK